MAWSYDNTDLGTDTASSRLNSVRLLVGDTDTNSQQVQDEEITFSLLETNNSIYFAAAWIARTLASKYSRYVDTDLDGELSESFSQLQQHYRDLSNQLEYQGKKTGNILGVSAGGISKTQIDVVQSDQDRFKPRITRDKFTYDSEVTSDY